MGYEIQLANIKADIIQCLTDKAKVEPIVLSKTPYSCLRILNGVLVYESTNGFSTVTSMFRLEELAMIADNI